MYERKKLLLKVVTFKVPSEEITDERVIDHNSHAARVWLGKHYFWAIHNGHGVEMYPVDDE